MSIAFRIAFGVASANKIYGQLFDKCLLQVQGSLPAATAECSGNSKNSVNYRGKILTQLSSELGKHKPKFSSCIRTTQEYTSTEK
ncbi:hypothetical protein V6N13_147052 [Hibiscus sabdariffa]